MGARRSAGERKESGHLSEMKAHELFQVLTLVRTVVLLASLALSRMVCVPLRRGSVEEAAASGPRRSWCRQRGRSAGNLAERAHCGLEAEVRDVEKGSLKVRYQGV